MFIVIWQYTVATEFQTQFEVLYGNDGQWVKLFQTDPGYIKTQLIQNTAAPTQYVTIDTWESQALYEQFLTQHQTEFTAIDQLGEAYTTIEKKIGWFTVL